MHPDWNPSKTSNSCSNVATTCSNHYDAHLNHQHQCDELLFFHICSFQNAQNIFFASYRARSKPQSSGNETTIKNAWEESQGCPKRIKRTFWSGLSYNMLVTAQTKHAVKRNLQMFFWNLKWKKCAKKVFIFLLVHISFSIFFGAMKLTSNKQIAVFLASPASILWNVLARAVFFKRWMEKTKPSKIRTVTPTTWLANKHKQSICWVWLNRLESCFYKKWPKIFQNTSVWQDPLFFDSSRAQLLIAVGTVATADLWTKWNKSSKPDRKINQPKQTNQTEFFCSPAAPNRYLQSAMKGQTKNADLIGLKVRNRNQQHQRSSSSHYAPEHWIGSKLVQKPLSGGSTKLVIWIQATVEHCSAVLPKALLRMTRPISEPDWLVGSLLAPLKAIASEWSKAVLNACYSEAVRQKQTDNDQCTTFEQPPWNPQDQAGAHYYGVHLPSNLSRLSLRASSGSAGWDWLNRLILLIRARTQKSVRCSCCHFCIPVVKRNFLLVLKRFAELQGLW